MFPLHSHDLGGLLLFRSRQRQLGEVVRVLSRPRQVRQHVAVYAVGVLKPSRLHLAGEVFRGRVVQVVQVATLILPERRRIPDHLDGVPKRLGKHLLDGEVVENESTLFLGDLTIAEALESLDGRVELFDRCVDSFLDEGQIQLGAVFSGDVGISHQRAHTIAADLAEQPDGPIQPTTPVEGVVEG